MGISTQYHISCNCVNRKRKNLRLIFLDFLVISIGFVTGLERILQVEKNTEFPFQIKRYR